MPYSGGGAGYRGPGYETDILKGVSGGGDYSRQVLLELNLVRDIAPLVCHLYLRKQPEGRNIARAKKRRPEPRIPLQVFLPLMKAARLTAFFLALWLLILKLPTQKCVPLQTSGIRV